MAVTTRGIDPKTMPATSKPDIKIDENDSFLRLLAVSERLRTWGYSEEGREVEVKLRIGLPGFNSRQKLGR